MEQKIGKQNPESEGFIDRIFQSIDNSEKEYLFLNELQNDLVGLDPFALFEILGYLKKSGYVEIKYVLEDSDGSFLGHPIDLKDIPSKVEDSFLEMRDTSSMKPTPVVLSC